MEFLAALRIPRSWHQVAHLPCQLFCDAISQRPAPRFEQRGSGGWFRRLELLVAPGAIADGEVVPRGSCCQPHGSQRFLQLEGFCSEVSIGESLAALRIARP